MAPQSALAIATGSVRRLVKEEASYYRELKVQEARLKKLTSSTEEDENHEWSLKQQQAAIEETRAVFAPLRKRITEALHRLEDQLDAAEAGHAHEDELKEAKDVITSAKAIAAEQ